MRRQARRTHRLQRCPPGWASLSCPLSKLLLSQQFKVAYPIDTIFPGSSLSILNENILVHEEGRVSLDWLHCFPNVAIRPLHLANVLGPIAQFWEISNDEKILSNFGLVRHSKCQTVLLGTVCLVAASFT